MKDPSRTKQELIEEISILKKKIKKLEKTEIAYKQAEGALRQRQEKYRTILENIDDGYYEVALNGDFTFFNASMCRIIYSNCINYRYLGNYFFLNGIITAFLKAAGAY